MAKKADRDKKSSVTKSSPPPRKPPSQGVPPGRRAAEEGVAGCPRCGIAGRCRIRDFSEQALAALIAWGELEPKHVAHGVCDDCYGELREVLIDFTEAPAAPTVLPAREAPAPVPQSPKRHKVGRKAS